MTNKEMNEAADLFIHNLKAGVYPLPSLEEKYIESKHLNNLQKISNEDLDTRDTIAVEEACSSSLFEFIFEKL